MGVEDSLVGGTTKCPGFAHIASGRHAAPGESEPADIDVTGRARPCEMEVEMAPNVPGIGGSARWLGRAMKQLSPRNQKSAMPRPRNKVGSMGATRNPSRNMQSLRGFGRY